jgi:hypothetical protein
VVLAPTPIANGLAAYGLKAQVSSAPQELSSGPPFPAGSTTVMLNS